MTITPKLTKLYIMANSSHKITINLAKTRPQNLDNVLMKWVVNVGRMVILITELIALGALFYRFLIDRQIIDLHDLIKKEQLFVSAQQNQEKEYRSIQNRLSVINEAKKETDLKLKIMNDILQASEDGVFSASNLSINQNIITVDGNTASVFTINNFIEVLKKYPEVNTIGIGEINSTDKGILFKLIIELKENKNLI